MFVKERGHMIERAVINNILFYTNTYNIVHCLSVAQSVIQI